MALQPICRLGDSASGTCNIHGPWTGTITTATSGFTCDGLPVARIGDSVLASCGHTFFIDSGSSVCTGADGIAIARQGDTVSLTINPGGFPLFIGSGALTGGSSVGSSE